MAKLLDRTVESEARDLVLDALSEGGFSPSEAIPGLIAAIYFLADEFGPCGEQALDEAANLLADGPGREEA